MTKIPNDDDGLFSQDLDLCSPESAKLFQTIIDLGYEIFEPSLPLRKVPGCQNANFQQDLLLVEKHFFRKWYRENKMEILNIEKPYEIVVFNTSEEYDIDTNNVPYGLLGFMI